MNENAKFSGLPQTGSLGELWLGGVRSTFLAALSVWCCVSSFAADYTYTRIVAPGQLSVEETLPFGINNAGVVIGTYTFADLTDADGFLLAHNRFLSLRVPGFTSKFAYGLNDTGLIVGQYYDGTTKGFIYSQNRFTVIEAPNSDNTSASGVNNLAHVVGYFDDDTGRHGFLLAGNSLTPIDYPAEIKNTLAFGINDSDDIVGDWEQEFLDDSHVHGFLLKRGKFTLIDVPKARGTHATGINNRGQIVGWFEKGGLSIHGYVQDRKNFSVIDYPGALFTIATGINDRGAIVGYYWDGISYRGFLASPRNSQRVLP